MSMSSGQSSPPMESNGGGPPCPHADAGSPPSVSAKKVWRAMQAAYLVVVKKHQPKLTALGVHLHHLLSSSKRNRNRRRRSSLAAAAPEQQHPALTYLLSSCRSMDPAAAVVHPYPRGRGGHRHRSSSRPAAATSLSCRSMDPAAAVCQYQYRPREVEFSCKSTPLHKRRRREQRLLRLQYQQGRRDHSSSETEYYGSAMAVTRLFELMDVEEEASKATDLAEYYDDDEGDVDLEATVAWPALTVGPAARQVRITDSPYMLWDDDSEEGWGGVDRRADEFIMRFHEQLRAQQPQPQRSTRYLVR